MDLEQNQSKRVLVESLEGVTSGYNYSDFAVPAGRSRDKHREKQA
jgi:hypothetical protein